MELSENTRIYYGGDMANCSGFGTIVKTQHDKWGSFVDITMDDGRDIARLPIIAFSEVYKGHGGTRFVTIAAYNAYKKELLKDSKFANYQEAI